MKIAIAGFGVEGRSNYAYFRQNFPEADIVIVDEGDSLDNIPVGATTKLGPGVFSDLMEFDIVVRTAGLSPSKISTAGRIWSSTNEFFEKCPAPIIGVTGTKGKGTTCSLITSILRAAGKKVHLVGNIGVPALEVLSNIQQNDIVIYELSSFQLWDLERSPHVAVVLMIEPDHLDVHSSLEQYVEAKSHITNYQSSEDVVIYHPTNEFSRKAAAGGSGRHLRYGVRDDGLVYVDMNNFCVQGDAICGVDTLHIAGRHNLENASAAISAARCIMPEVTNLQIQEGLGSFDGLPHRLKFVAEKQGVKFYDDSIATTPGSAIAALRSFDGGKVIILGGSDKGASYGEVVAVAKQEGARVVAIGQTGQAIYELCLQMGVTVVREEGLMEEVVDRAAELASPGDVVILSPASASFGQYQSYVDRGNKFIKAVESLQ